MNYRTKQVGASLLGGALGAPTAAGLSYALRKALGMPAQAGDLITPGIIGGAVGFLGGPALFGVPKTKGLFGGESAMNDLVLQLEQKELKEGLDEREQAALDNTREFLKRNPNSRFHKESKMSHLHKTMLAGSAGAGLGSLGGGTLGFLLGSMFDAPEVGGLAGLGVGGGLGHWGALQLMANKKKLKMEMRRQKKELEDKKNRGEVWSEADQANYDYVQAQGL